MKKTGQMKNGEMKRNKKAVIKKIRSRKKPPAKVKGNTAFA